ncbi:MAG: T9SS type A sorting domain-containing protein [Saprospiraceae bacterium]|jgi:hypothetical protein
MDRRVRIFLFLICIFLVSIGTGSAQSYAGSNQSPIDGVSEDIKVYPNPTVDYFQITNGLNIRKVVVYNMFGKEVKSYFHYNNAQHEVSDLKSGMYIVKLLDERNKVIKSIKLHKNITGV